MTNESKMVQCECGYCGPISKFCPECGKKFESPAEGVGQEMKEYICECGTVVTGKFCPNCGRPVPENMIYALTKEHSLKEKQTLTEHGWRNESGTLRMILRDGRLQSCCIPGAVGSGFSPIGSATGQKEARLDTGYSFSEIGYGIGGGMIGAMMGGGMMGGGMMGVGMLGGGMLGGGMMGGAQTGRPGVHHPNEEFVIYLRQCEYRQDVSGPIQADYRLLRLWYGSGTLHADLYFLSKQVSFTVDLLQDDNVEISFAEPEVKVGLTCPKCGSEFQTGDTCEKCGEVLNWVVLFSGSTYASCNPPAYSGFRVCEFSDEKLIYEYYSNEIKGRRYISASVLDAAYAIIKEYHIDEWEKYKDRFTGMMGGSVSVWYRDGDQLVGSSLDHMGSTVQGAYGALMALFHKNIL